MAIERLDLKIGFKCNNNCLSCPQAHRRSLGDLSEAEVKEQILAGLDDGAKELVLTGGEPTVRNDFFELVSFARDSGYQNIQLQSNGRMLYYPDFARKTVEAGVTEFCIGLHSHKAKFHDYLTQSPGSFEQAVQGIRNLKKLNQFVAMNSVIHKLDFEFLRERAKLAVALGVDQFQLAFIHCAGNAFKNMALLCPKKSKVMPFVHDALSIAIKNNIFSMVEAYPYCFMKGFEKQVSDLYMPSAEIRDAEGVVKDFDTVRKSVSKVKHKKCRDCRFFNVCEGPWKEYPAKFGWSEFVPVKGKKIIDAKEILVMG